MDEENEVGRVKERNRRNWFLYFWRKLRKLPVVCDEGLKKNLSIYKEKLITMTKHQKCHKKKDIQTVSKYLENGIKWHEPFIAYEQPWWVIAEQTIVVDTREGETPMPDGTNMNRIRLRFGSISEDVIPTVSNPVGGVDSRLVKLTVTGATLTSQEVVLTFAENPQELGIVEDTVVTVTEFTGNDVVFNGCYEVTAVGLTSITYELAITTADRVATSFGKVVASIGEDEDFFEEQLWLCQPYTEAENFNTQSIFANLLVASAKAGDTEFWVSQVPRYFLTDGGAGFTEIEPDFSSPYSLVLRRVRLTGSAYGSWVSMMDHYGNCVIGSRYAVNQWKSTSMYLMMYEKDPNTGAWKNFNPTTDGENLRVVGKFQVATWKVSGLKLGHEYTAVVVIPTPELINLINSGSTLKDIWFQRQLADSHCTPFNAHFRMPYPKNSCEDIRLLAASCEENGGNEILYTQLSGQDYDAYLNMGDHVYADYGGMAVLSFNLPNNSGSPLGFSNGRAYGILNAFTDDDGPLSPFNQTAKADNPLAPNTVIDSTNNQFVIDGELRIIPDGNYNPTQLRDEFQSLLGSAYVVILHGDDKLEVERPTWSQYASLQFWTQRMRGIGYTKFQASVGSYNFADDHEVYNDWHAVSSYQQRRQGTPDEVAISVAVEDDPEAALFEVDYDPLELNPDPSPAVPDHDIDSQLEVYDIFAPNRFVTDNRRFGYVRNGCVEIIKLETIPFRNAQGQYEYYQQAGKWMRPDQLDFLIHRLTVSDAKVKIVCYSKRLAMSDVSLEDQAQEQQKYVDIAVKLGFDPTKAATTYKKVLKLDGIDDIWGYTDWFTTEFIPRLEATGAKNVFFVTGGDHIGTLNRLTKGSPFIEIGTSGIGTPFDGETTTGTKNGQPNVDICLNYTKDKGVTEIIVSRRKKTVTVSFLPINGQKSSVIFPFV